MASERKSWMFWVLNNDHMPVRSRGFECPPNDDCYWFPELGFSTWSVYQTRDEAVARARAIAEGDIAFARQRLAILDTPAPGEKGEG